MEHALRLLTGWSIDLLELKPQLSSLTARTEPAIRGHAKTLLQRSDADQRGRAL